LKYLIPILILSSFTVSWSQKENERVDNFEVMRHVRGDSVEILVGAPRDTCLIDSTVIAGLRYNYRVRAVNFYQSSPYSRFVSGMYWDILPDNSEHTQSKSWAGNNGAHLLVVNYPSGPWLFSWAYRPERESMSAYCLFDDNGDREINLSDLTLLAEQLAADLSLFSMFAGMYNKPAYFEFIWERETLPGTEADQWLMERLTRQSWKSSTPAP